MSVDHGPVWTELPAVLGAIPSRREPFQSPFDELGPPPLARAAATVLQEELTHGWIAPGVSTEGLLLPESGKMFGVLVVELPGGGAGFLRAFSGTIGGRFDVYGYAPPIFERNSRAAVEIPGERVVSKLTRLGEELAHSPEIAEIRQAAVSLAAQQEEQVRLLRERHSSNRSRRRDVRSLLDAQTLRDVARDEETRRRLESESRGDKAERRRLLQRNTAAAACMEELVSGVDRCVELLDRLRRVVSRRLMREIHDTYQVRNARGETVPLRELYSHAEPPGGSGDCAAAKLLAYAYANKLRPVALAEFWWGAPPAGGGRVAGVFYPSCPDKCGPLLPFMLRGLKIAKPRRFSLPDSSALSLHVVYEDEWIVVVDKPSGLLSVPSRNGGDSVHARLCERYAEGEGPLLVHRLDLDTSGLLVAARDPDTHAALQRQFVRRTVNKRYVAWVEGRPPASQGTIDLPIRVDVHDRPRQIYDPEHGQPALTRWEVSEWGRTASAKGKTATAGSNAKRSARETAKHGPRDGEGLRVVDPSEAAPRERTRVIFFPHTGRTHQLRVHAAHPLGLDAPIVGDRLYGREADRLMLHAEYLEFVHPATGERVHFESPAPF